MTAYQRASSTLRYVRVGALLGASLAVVDWSVVHGPALWTAGDLEGLLGLMLTAAVTAAGYATVALVAGGLVTVYPTRRDVGAYAAALALALLCCLHLASLAVQVTAGSFVTLGALQFCGASVSECTGEALGAHLLLVLALSFVVGLTFMLCLWQLKRPQGTAGYRGLASAGVGVVAGVLAAPLVAAEPALAQSSAELAFIASLEQSAEASAQLPEADADQLAAVNKQASLLLGPAQSEHERWLARATPSAAAPNILIVMLESVPQRRLGYGGYGRDVSPNLDRLAARGLVFRRAWTTATHSNYAQMAILSSLFPRRRSGLDTYTLLDYPRILWHDAFHALGYDTGTFSSQDERWQGMLDFQTTSTPTEYFHADTFPGPHFGEGHSRTIPDEIAEQRASQFIRDHQGERWAAYVNLQATHFPYNLPPGAERKYGPHFIPDSKFSYVSYPKEYLPQAINRYDNAMAYVDHQIGALEQTLRDTDQLNNTLWVITSDHGELFWEYGLVTHGRTLYEGEARVPLVFHWPDGLKPKQVWEPVSTLDTLPTLLELSGAEPHPAFQGRSLARLRAESESSDLVEDAPAVFMNIQGLRSADAVVCYPWKLIHEHPGPVKKLFHLGRDPGETKNLVEERPGVARQLTLTLQGHIAAQMRFHASESKVRLTRYAPRLRPCPHFE